LIRVPYLEDLVNHLKSSTILNGHGMPDVPDLNGDCIFVKAQYRGIDEDNQFSPAIWIIPMESTPVKKIDGQNDCKQPMIHRLMICAVVKNVYGCRDHFEENVSGGQTSLIGSFMEASKFEMLLRDTILEFNESVVDASGTECKSYQRLQLCELPEPDEHNGHLIMPTLWETRYVF